MPAAQFEQVESISIDYAVMERSDQLVVLPIDVNKSGTRKEELLMHPEEFEKVRVLRRVLSDMHPVEAMEMLVNKSKKTKSNLEFLLSMNLG